MSPNNEDVSVPVDSPTSNGVTTGLPPTGDDHNIAQILLKKINDLEANYTKENTRMNNEIKMMKKAIGPKALYAELGGDFGLYSNLKKLLPRLRRHYANDEDGLQQLERWAKKCDKEGNVKVGLLVAGGAVMGAAVSVSIIVSNHVGIAAGSAAVVGIAAGPVVWILVGGIAVGVLLAAGVWAGYKLYQYKKLSKDQAGTPGDKENETNGDMENDLKYILRGEIGQNVHIERAV